MFIAFVLKKYISSPKIFLSAGESENNPEMKKLRRKISLTTLFG
jgi:hypothetical protein